jgi:hypothetical protein
MKKTALGIVCAFTLALAGCYYSPMGTSSYVEPAQEQDPISLLSATLVDCGWDFYTPAMVTLTNGSDQLIEGWAAVGWYDDSGTLVESYHASATIPSGQTAQADTLIGPDVPWATCEIIEVDGYTK